MNQEEQFTISLKDFSGPLDLLLHLIRTQEFDIFDLPIAKVTDQFLDFIEQKKGHPLDQRSDYLLMAADLVKIKSRFLLPVEKKNIEEDPEQDPRRSLVEALVEYERYQKVVNKLEKLIKKRNLYFDRPQLKKPDYVHLSPITRGIDIDQLKKAFLTIVKRKFDQLPKTRSIEQERYTIEQKTSLIKNIFKHRSMRFKINFFDLFEGQTNIDELITTFLAILEMAKDKELIIHENKADNNIIIKKG